MLLNNKNFGSAIPIVHGNLNHSSYSSFHQAVRKLSLNGNFGVFYSSDYGKFNMILPSTNSNIL